MEITLQQFERLYGLRDAALRDENRRSHITGQPIVGLLNPAQHQSALYGAIIDIIGYEAASNVPVLEHYADELITDCLIGKVVVIDGEAA